MCSGISVFGWIRFPDTSGDQLPGGGFRPTAIGGRGCGRRVEDAGDGGRGAAQGGGLMKAVFRKAAHSHEKCGLHVADGFGEVAQAGIFNRLHFGGGEFVRCEIGTRFAHPDQRAVVEDEVVGEEIAGIREAFGEQSPEAATTDFRARAGESFNRSFWVFSCGFSDGGFDFHPVAHGGDLTKRNTGLGHAEGARIHAEEQHAFGGGAEAVEVRLVRLPGVVERVIGVGNRWGEGESGEFAGEASGRFDPCGVWVHGVDFHARSNKMRARGK